MSIGNNKKALIVSMSFGILCLLLGGYWTLNSTPKVKESEKTTLEYVFTKTPIKKGEIIKEENLQIKESAMKFEGAYENMDDVIGKTANTNIEENKIIINTFVGAGQLLKNVVPSAGFRSVALPIKKSAIPPYIQPNKKYDLYTGSNSIKIENVKILDIIDQPENDSNKMIIFEIKNPDVPVFVANINKKDGDSYMLIEKNQADYGEYKFTNTIQKQEDIKISTPVKDGYIPPLENFENFSDNKNIEPVSDYKPTKEVEIIVGNQKTKMEFSE